MTLTTKETTSITQAIQDAIIHEKQMRESVALLDQHNLIVRGKRQEVIDNLIFFTSPQSFGEMVESLLLEVEAGFYRGDELLQAEYLNFLVELALALRSLLPRWNLLDTVKNGQDALTPSQVQTAAEVSRHISSAWEVRFQSWRRRSYPHWKGMRLRGIKPNRQLIQRGQRMSL